MDRSAAYMARYIAKNVVASGVAKKCEIRLAYAIGVAEPVSVGINTFGTSKLSDEMIIHKIKDKFDLMPDGIIKTLDLRRQYINKRQLMGILAGQTWICLGKK